MAISFHAVCPARSARFGTHAFRYTGSLFPTPFVVDTDRARYESGAEKYHVDVALRWSYTAGGVDLGLYHFYGTGRQPSLMLDIDAGGDIDLLPRYEIIHQTGLDLQYTTGSWLLKLEAFSRSGQGDWFWAAGAGVEYTFHDLGGTGLDLGLLGEYLYDSRDASAMSLAPFEDDLFFGARLAFNDTQDTQILAGAIVDRENGSTFFNIEAVRRLADHWTLEAELRAFINVDKNDPLASLRDDSYFQLRLRRYF